MSDTVAVLHDRFTRMGGGAKVAFEFARIFDAPIYTAYVLDFDDIPDDIDVIPLFQDKYTSGISSRIVSWKSSGQNPIEPVSVLIDWAQGTNELENYDIILGSGTLCKSYVPEENQTVYNYPHSPPRWLYDLYRERIKSYNFPLYSFGIKAAAKIMRALDKEANDYVDQFIANSETVQRRIERYYGRDSEVVYPPVIGDWRHEEIGDYFITWSDLTPHKRVDLVVEAFQELDEKLIVAGDGSEKNKIKAMSEGHDNITFKGYVEEIEDLVSHSKAVIYAPKEEDFGLVGAEGLCSGKPLIGVNEGYTKHQINPGENGELFESNVESLQSVVKNFSTNDYNYREIEKNSDEKYNYSNFERQIKQIVLSK